MTLKPLTLADLQTICEWRNEPEMQATLRTPYMLTEGMQEDFYRDVICNRESRARFNSG